MIIEFSDRESLHKFWASGARVNRGLCHWETRRTQGPDSMKTLERLMTIDRVGRALVTWARGCVGGGHLYNTFMDRDVACQNRKGDSWKKKRRRQELRPDSGPRSVFKLPGTLHQTTFQQISSVPSVAIGLRNFCGPEENQWAWATVYY